jgi:ABC-type amino acid transport substrate-binding protein
MRYLFSCLLLVFFSTGNAHTEQRPQDMQRIIDNGSIVVAMYFEDVPPFFMHSANGELVGFEVELAHDIAQRLGVTVEFNRAAQTFDELVDIVANREADIAISMLSNTLDRAVRIRFSNPYITLRQSLLINRLRFAQIKSGGTDFENILNSRGLEIGVIEGTSYIAFAHKDYPQARIIPYKDWDSVVHDVLNGTIFAVLYDEIEIRNWHTSNPDGALYVQTVIMDNKKDPIAIAVHPEDEQLLAWLNLYLEKIISDGTNSMLIKKYFQSDDLQRN